MIISALTCCELVKLEILVRLLKISAVNKLKMATYASNVHFTSDQTL